MLWDRSTCKWTEALWSVNVQIKLRELYQTWHFLPCNIPDVVHMKLAAEQLWCMSKECGIGVTPLHFPTSTKYWPPKIVSEVAHDNWNRLKLFHKLEETTALNVSIEPLKTMACGSRFQSDIAREKTDYCLWWILQGKWKRRSACDSLKSGLTLSCLAIATLSIAILYTITN